MFNFVDEVLEDLEKNHLLRDLKSSLTPPGPWVEIVGGKRVLQFASNNYLGLANHPEVINASKSILLEYGAGSTGSRLLSGSYHLHDELEKSLSDFQKTEASLLFTSGYTANLGVISSLVGKEDVVFSDELNHASIIDGIKLSGALKFIYEHNNMDALKELLKANSSKGKRSFIVSESVFGMDGDISNLEKIAELSYKYNCIPIIDEAHAIGVFGKTGAGLIEESELFDSFPIKIGTCSKAIGVQGGFCSAPKKIISLLQNKARSFIFTTSISPVLVAAIKKSLELVIDGQWRRDKLWENAKELHSKLSKSSYFKVNELKTPIVSLRFNDEIIPIEVANRLFNECHIWAPVIRPPSVKTSRIKMTPISTHSLDDIKYLVKAVDFVAKDLSLVK